MNCPTCGKKTRVIHKHKKVDGTSVRYRRCKVCKGRFTTKIIYIPCGSGLAETEIIEEKSEKKLGTYCNGSNCLNCMYHVCLEDIKDGTRAS